MNTRKKFLTYSALSALTIIAPGSSADIFSQQVKKDKGPALDKDLVKDFVGKAHKDLDAVKSMLSQEPGLLNASWDWGGGDFETAMEAAGHVGDRDIALFLLSNGARMNIFCAAMLGHLDIVKQILIVFPELKSSKGPHGLQLIHHAKKGGDEAKSVLEYLESIGAS